MIISVLNHVHKDYYKLTCKTVRYSFQYAQIDTTNLKTNNLIMIWQIESPMLILVFILSSFCELACEITYKYTVFTFWTYHYVKDSLYAKLLKNNSSQLKILPKL